jgi:hypothetical protein
MGLAGFGIALVAMAFLPYLMSAADAIVLLTIYAAVMSLVLLVQLRESVEPRALLDLTIGTIVGTPLGVWGARRAATEPLEPSDRADARGGLRAPRFAGSIPRSSRATGGASAPASLAGTIGGAVGLPGRPSCSTGDAALERSSGEGEFTKRSSS